MNRDDSFSREFSTFGGAPDDQTAGRHDAQRRAVTHPYRDRRDALVERRRALEGELARVEEAARRSAKLRAQLRLVDEELQRSSRPLVERLRIASPCRARWEDMVGDDVSRHCARCDRDVFDVSAMTRVQVEALFASETRTPCVRLMRRRDGRVITADCPTAPKLGARRTLHVAAAGVLLGASAGATLELARQTRAPQHAEATLPVTPAPAQRATPRVPIRLGAFTSDPPPDEEAELRTGTMGTPILDDVDYPSDEGPPDASPAETQRRVREVDEHTWEVDRRFVASLLTNQTAFMHAATVIPHEVDGSAVGLKIYGIRRSSILGRLGLQNGDMLAAINGYPLTSQESALEAFARLQDTDVLTLLFVRRGEVRFHMYRIVDRVDTWESGRPRIVLPRPRRYERP